MRNGGGEGGGRLAVLVDSLVERFRTSLFGLPSIWVAGSVLLWLLMRVVDAQIDAQTAPDALVTTVDSARSLLGAVAAGTITAASVVFSLTLVAIQLSSSTYSSRVVRTFMRDRFQQNMIGIVVGTFFYSLLVLRDVRGPLDNGGNAEIPGASVVLATVLALVAILALLASISHTAMSVRVSHVSAAVLRDARAAIRDHMDPRSGGEDEPDRLDLQAPGVIPSPLRSSVPARASGELVLSAPRGGWVQQVGLDALADAVPEGSQVRLEVAVGTYVFEGAPLATIRPPEGGGQDPDEGREFESSALAAFGVGRERTMQQDIALGLTMLEDIALRALSPGINDPNTARAVIPQLGDLLVEILSRRIPPSRIEIRGVVITRDAPSEYLDYLEAAFGQIRRVARAQPEVMLTIVRTLGSVGSELVRLGADTPVAMAALSTSMLRLLPPPAGTASADAAAQGPPGGSERGTWSDPGDPAVIEAGRFLAGIDWFRDPPGR